MSNQRYTVGEVARIAQVTVRTLHHYDEIGLLTPSVRSRAGYRLYSRADIARLQQIRFHRELGMALEEIRRILDAPDFDARAALREHRRQLEQRVNETQALVETIDRMLADEGETTMTAEEMFDGFQPEEHRAEAEERWGNTPAWKESQRRVNSYGPEEWKAIKAEDRAILDELAACQAAGDSPDSETAMAAAEKHRLHIDRWFYSCSPFMHQALSQMYVTDPRFAEYFDRRADGLAGFVSAAIAANAARPRGGSA